MARRERWGVRAATLANSVKNAAHTSKYFLYCADFVVLSTKLTSTIFTRGVLPLFCHSLDVFLDEKYRETRRPHHAGCDLASRPTRAHNRHNTNLSQLCGAPEAIVYISLCPGEWGEYVISVARAHLKKKERLSFVHHARKLKSW